MTLLADVAVIGGGPAGAAAARLLASWGQSVIVLARAPRQPPLAESLPPSCVKLFDEIGVRAAVDRAGFIRATGNTVQWADRARRVEMFDRSAHSAIRYRATSSTNSCSPARRSPARRSSATSPCVKRSARATCGEWQVDRASGRGHDTCAMASRLQRASGRHRAPRLAATRLGGENDRPRGNLGARRRMAARGSDAHSRRELRERMGVVRSRLGLASVRHRDARSARDDRARPLGARRRVRGRVGADACSPRARGRRDDGRRAVGVRRDSVFGGASGRRWRAAGRRRGIVRRPTIVVRRQESAGLGVAGGGRRSHRAHRLLGDGRRGRAVCRARVGDGRPPSARRRGTRARRGGSARDTVLVRARGCGPGSRE